MKRWIIRGLIVLGSIMVTLILAEIFLRLFDPQVTFQNLVLSYDFHCFIKGTYYPDRLKPNTNCLLRSTENQFPPVYIKTNSLGMRNPEIAIPKPLGTIRILMVGDSYVTGWGVTNEESLPRVIESTLRIDYPDKKIEVINAGLPGAGPNYYYLFLKNVGVKLQPDIIVIGFYMLNDIADNVYYTRWMKTDPKGLPVVVAHSLDTIDSSGNIMPSGLSPKFTVPILKYSHLFALLSDTFYHDPGNSPDNPLNVHECLYKPDCHTLDDAKLKTKLLFEGIKTLADSMHSQFLVAIFPAQLQMDRKARLKYDIRVPLLASDRNRPYEEFGEFFKENNIPYLDMRTDFAKFPVSETYFANDDHWTPTGTVVAADAIIPKLSDMIEPK